MEITPFRAIESRASFLLFLWPDSGNFVPFCCSLAAIRLLLLVYPLACKLLISIAPHSTTTANIPWQGVALAVVHKQPNMQLSRQ
ncbi:MAG TPA: hypothetical protein ENN50_09455 [Prosthecochloris aestuarii]|uniref:Uncharacterized protein n=1 Tax=Prosthecochloris aestuarii TaxID=1102 RepID=A0A831SQN0_PROAE|nr:hypothetical protein [Prosthecochloris aestuarii]